MPHPKSTACHAELQGSVEVPSRPEPGCSSKLALGDESIGDLIASAVANFLAGGCELSSDDEGDTSNAVAGCSSKLALGDDSTGDLIASAVANFLAGGCELSSDDEGDTSNAGISQDGTIAIAETLPMVEDVEAPDARDLMANQLQSAVSILSVAILSMYRDRIHPTFSNVNRRLGECEYQNVGLLQRKLLSICACHPEKFRIVPIAGDLEVVILLAQEPRWFEGWINIESDVDAYNNSIWEAFADFLRQGRITLPHDTYLAAKELRLRGIRGLDSLCLAELEHLVKIALGKRSLLVRSDNVVKAAKLPISVRPCTAWHRAKTRSFNSVGKVSARSVARTSMCWSNEFH